MNDVIRRQDVITAIHIERQWIRDTFRAKDPLINCHRMSETARLLGIIGKLESDPDAISKSRLLSYLNDLSLTYAPVDVDRHGRVIGGDEDLYMFVRGLMEELEGW